MNFVELKKRVRTLTIESLGLTDDRNFHDNDNLLDLGADELDLVELAMTLEETFDVDMLCDETLKQHPTVEKLAELVRDALAQSA